jgi:hypothetical protein
MKRLVAFGACNVLNCSIHADIRNEDSWVKHSANLLNLEYSNHGQKSIDNNYIYHNILSNLQNFDHDNDFILVAWCDISSRLFVYDNNVDPEILEYSLTYSPGITKDTQWIRSQGPKTKKWDGDFDYKKTFGNPYYDEYFGNYFNETLALLETLQKVSSISAILSDRGFKFTFTSDKNFFKHDSLPYINLFKKNINWFYPDHFGIVEFTKHFNLTIDHNNCHLTEQGHAILTEHFIRHYNAI